jgi:hypothetical protein
MDRQRYNQDNFPILYCHSTQLQNNRRSHSHNLTGNRKKN